MSLFGLMSTTIFEKLHARCSSEQDSLEKVRREFTRKICRTLAPMYTRKCVGHPIWVISHVESWSRMSIRRTVDTFFSYCGVEPATVERRRNVVSTQGLSHYSLAPELCDKLLPPPAVRQSNGGSPTVISNALSASNISSTGSEPVRNLLVVEQDNSIY